MANLLRQVVAAAIAAAVCLTTVGGSASADTATGTCKPYHPGADGRGQKVTKVTDEATAKDPVVIELDSGPGLGISSTTPHSNDPTQADIGYITHAYNNIQVDTASKTTRLFVRLEFPVVEDYDLFLRTARGSTNYFAGGTNQAPLPVDLNLVIFEITLDGTGHGGHSEMGAEQLDGVRVKDCAGFTVDAASATTPGGPITIKYWLKKPVAGVQVVPLFA